MSEDRPPYGAAGTKRTVYQELRVANEVIRTLTAVVIKTLWMARRYADMRMTYAVSDYNEAAQLAMTVIQRERLSVNGAIFARDGHGRKADGLPPEEVSACERDIPARWVLPCYIRLLEEVIEEAATTIVEGTPTGAVAIGVAYQEAIERRLKDMRAELADMEGA